MSDETKIQEIVVGIGLLNTETEGDFTQAGAPNIEKLEAVTGIATITGEERDEAFEIFTAEKEAAEATKDSNVKLVKMVREVPEGSDDPTSCDVHPSEVSNYAKGGWVKE